MIMILKVTCKSNFFKIKTHDSELRGQEEAQQRDHWVSYLHVALPSNSQTL